MVSWSGKFVLVNYLKYGILMFIAFAVFFAMGAGILYGKSNYCTLNLFQHTQLNGLMINAEVQLPIKPTFRK